MKTPEALARRGEAVAARWHAWEWTLLKARCRLLLIGGRAAPRQRVLALLVVAGDWQTLAELIVLDQAEERRAVGEGERP